MKKIFTFIFVLFCTATISQAQVVMTYSSHGLKSGDTHVSQEVEFQDQGSAGQNVVWDFSNLTPMGDVVTSLVGAEITDSYNIGITRDNDEVLFVYNVNEYANEYKGYQSGDYIVSYEQPIIKTQYPQTYGSFFKGNFEGTIAYGNNILGNTSGSYSTQGDATGVIMLPNGVILPVLRVKTMERIDQWACGGTVTEVEKYLWYAQDTRYPVFVSMIITTTSLSDNTSTISRKSALNMDVNAPVLKSAESDIAYTVSPNPFKDNLTINYSLPQSMKVGIELYDAQGMMLTAILPVQQQKEGEHSLTYNAAAYTQLPGVYFLKLRFGEKTYSEKIVK